MLISHLDLLTSVRGFQVLSGMKLPIKAAFAISRAGRKVENALNDFNQVRAKLVEQHAEKDVDGKIVEESPGIAKFVDKEAFEKDFEILQAIEVDIQFTAISVEDLGEISIEPQVLRSVGWLIV